MGYGYGKGYGYSYGLVDATRLLIPYDQILPLSLSSSAGASPLPLGDRGLTDLGTLESGALTREAPVSPSTGFVGQRLSTFFDDFYNRIYVEPTSIDFGLFVEQQTQPIEIWNAYFDTVTLETVGKDTLINDGVTVDHETLPQTIKPLEFASIDVIAALTGSLRIEGNVALVFDTGLELTIPVTGVRARLWPFVPNWSTPWTESLEYRTEVIKSRSGREQRIAVRSVPRKRIEYSTLVKGIGRRRLDQYLDYGQHLEHAIADLPRRVKTTSALSGQSVTVESIPDWLTTDLLVAVVNGQNTVLKYVEDISGTTLTFNDAETGDWPAGSLLHPVLLGFVDSTIASQRHTDTVAEARIGFGTNPGRQEYEEPDPSPQSFNGKDLFLLRPNWAQIPAVDFMRDTETVDYGSGVIARHDPVRYGTRLSRLMYTHGTVEDARVLRSIFQRCKGQRGEFYMPTGESDMDLAVAVLSGTSSMRVKGVDIFNNYAASSVFKSIYLQKRDGTAIPKRIATMFTVNDVLGHDTVIQFTSSWSGAIATDEVDKISWMPCRRFATDSLTIEWLTDSVSRAQISVRTIEDFVAEG